VTVFTTGWFKFYALPGKLQVFTELLRRKNKI